MDIMASGARPKTCSSPPQRTVDEIRLDLEQWILERLCISGGSLSLGALHDALVENGVINHDKPPRALQMFLTDASPHNVFRLDEDVKRNECTVRTKTTVVLCEEYNPRKDYVTCQGGTDCQNFHLCRHFISGGCKRGQKCHWPHHLRDHPHNMKVLQLYGLAHLKDEYVMQILKQSWIEFTVPDVCDHYNNMRGCIKKNSCSFLHICRHFIEGDCRFDTPTSQCRYSHDMKGPQPMQVWMKYGIEAQSTSPTDLLRIVREKKKQENPQSINSEEDQEEECTGEENRLPEICEHYNRKGCNKGNRCSYLHICSFFVIGQCKFADKCRKSHDVKSLQPMLVWKRLRIDADNKTAEELLSHIQSSQRKDGEEGNQRRKLLSTGSIEAEKLDKNEICEYKLRGKCHFGDVCRKLHCEQNFLWQWSGDDGKSWISCDDDVNTAVEEVFCNISRNTTGSKSSSIDFKMMKWNYPGGIRSMRRLETPMNSSDDVAWKKVISTNWQWYYLDNEDIWVQYNMSKEIEEAYQKYLSTGQDKKFPFETASFKYALNFSTMRQTNLKVGTKRKARRRPCKFVTIDMIERSLKKMTVLATILPITWESHLMPTDSLNNFVPYKLDPQTHKVEYEKVSQHFDEMMDKKFILKIERIQNEELWDEFVRKRQKMKESQTDNTNSDVQEELLFHGTRRDFIEAICQQNFDNRVSGSNVGTKYGQGCYFSKSAKYSDCYAGLAHNGNQHMFLVRVLVGSFIRGDPSYRRPPLKDATKLHGPMFDSCVDKVINPLIFVIFDSRQVYPEYLITYKKK